MAINTSKKAMAANIASTRKAMPYPAETIAPATALLRDPLFDPKKVSYETLLDVYWRNINPFDDKGQFCGRGDQYRSAIFVANNEQKLTAEASKRKLEERFDRAIATDILPAGPFYCAKEYHQDYYKKNPLRYRFYRFSCGRDARLSQVWGDEAGSGEK